mgnify:CR=1 FL=1
MLRPGFEPGSPARKDSTGFTINYSAVKEEFKQWLYNRIDISTATYYLHYLDKYANKEIKSPEDLYSILRDIEGKGVRRWVSKAFRNLLTFYEEVKGIDSTILDKFRKVCRIEQADVRDVFIDDSELIDAYKSLRDEKSKLLFELLVYSGIRLRQAIEMLKNFDPQNLIIIEDKGIARYPILSLSKGQKKGFFAYMPADFAKKLRKIEISYSHAKDLIRHDRVSANSIRKWHYNFLIMHGVPPEVADFIQGRRPATVGAMHYLAKARQADEFYSKVVELFPLREKELEERE